ncbi:HutD/Ves family protein [Achromobacter aloeverae]
MNETPRNETPSNETPPVIVASPARVLRLDDLPATPWKNGGGVTRELARAELPGGSGFAWRLSIADIDRPGPFSDFQGYRRQLILLAGHGLHLGGPGMRGVRLDRPGDMHVFDGAAPVSATLYGGPCRDVNLMTAHAAPCHWEVQLLRDASLDLAGGFALFPVQGQWKARAVDADKAASSAPFIAGPGDVLTHLDAPAASTLHCTGSGLAILLRLRPHQT